MTLHRGDLDVYAPGQVFLYRSECGNHDFTWF